MTRAKAMIIFYTDALRNQKMLKISGEVEFSDCFLVNEEIENINFFILCTL